MGTAVEGIAHGIHLLGSPQEGAQCGERQLRTVAGGITLHPWAV
ncbi:hypothetical protein BN2537_603 [Streptomyces venezuelae]|nr:hypothetical protein BN2537_603 [Streptomyces venezuelae]